MHKKKKKGEVNNSPSCVIFDTTSHCANYIHYGRMDVYLSFLMTQRMEKPTKHISII